MLETDRNLLFGVLVLQADLIGASQFVEACSAWSARKESALADLLVERGWLSPADRALVERLLERKLLKHGGDASASLAEVAVGPVRQALVALEDPEVSRTVDSFSEEASTVLHERATRQRYSLSRLHARGGIGQVWLARDDDLGREVALKELRPDRAGQPSVLARFLQEARITGQLEHPSIIPVHELSRPAGDAAPFYTMRFVRGSTLSDAARLYHRDREAGRDDPLTLRALLDAFVACCNAVAYAHARGVIHRDLKGQNVALGDFGEVMLLDWGLAKVVDGDEGDHPPVSPGDCDPPEATQQGQVVGTPAYMAPEQAEGRLDRVGRAADVYGLGAMLYEILVGRPPFTGSDTADVLRRVVAEPPVRPRDLVASCPPPLESICLKALAKRPEGRYASAKEMADEVRRWMADEPVEAHPDPPQVRLARWMRRHRSGVAVTAALLVAAVVGLTIGTALLSRANARVERQRLVARQNFDRARRAVDEYYTRVSEDELLKPPGLQPLRKQLLDGALRYYREFLEQGGDDPELIEESARASFRVGMISNELGRPAEALEAFEHSLRLIGQLQAARPGDHDLKHFESKLRNNVGLALESLGRYDEARLAYDRAIAISEGLIAEHPDGSDHAFDLANQLSNIAKIEKERGDLTRAGELYRRALGLRERVVAAHPDDPVARAGLGRAVNNVANVESDLNHRQEALRLYQQAVQIQEEVTARGHPVDPSSQSSGLVHALANLGTLLAADPSTRDEGRARLERSRDLARALAESNPAVPIHLRDLARALRLLADLESGAGNAAEAAARADEAVKASERLIAGGASAPEDRLYLGRDLWRFARFQQDLGHPDRALAAYGRAAEVYRAVLDANPNDQDFRRELARMLYNAAFIHREAARWGPCREQFLKAVEVMTPAIEVPNPAPESLALMAKIQGNLGCVALATDDAAEAEAATRRAIKRQREALVAHPGDAEGLSDLAAHVQNLAMALAAQGRHRDAIDALWDIRDEFAPSPAGRLALARALLTRPIGTPPEVSDLALSRSVELLRTLVREQPNEPANRRMLGAALNDLATRPGRTFDEKVAMLREAVDHQTQALDAEPGDADSRRFLFNHYNNLYVVLRDEGRISEALDAAEARNALYAQNADSLVVFADAIARCVPLARSDAERAALADRAIEVLRSSVAAGLRDVDRLDRGDGFAPIRDRSDFRALVAKVADRRFPSDPFAHRRTDSNPDRGSAPTGETLIPARRRSPPG